MRVQRIGIAFTCLSLCTAAAALRSPILGLEARRDGDWNQALRNSQACGTSQRCRLEFDGQDAKTGEAVQGNAAVVASGGEGLLLDLNGQRLWANPGKNERAGARHVVPVRCTLRITGTMKTKDRDVLAEGRTVSNVTRQLWDMVMDAPSPDTYSPAYDWKSDEVVLTGTITPEGPFHPDKLAKNKSIAWDGKHLIFDHATVCAAVNQQLNVPVRAANLKVRLPAIVPDPKMVPNPFEAGFLDS